MIRLYFSIYALHVSGCISPSSGAILISPVSYLVYASTTRMVPAYTKFDVQLIKVVPEDGLT
jgi:hypothetical protein